MAESNVSSNFSNTPMCIAVDTWGSTAGSTLKSEIWAIEQISELVKPEHSASLEVLPWNHVAYAPIPLPESIVTLKYIQSSGGTDPSCLYSDSNCLEALRKCGMWFLFTDGKISSQQVENFARNTTQLGLHGFANVVVIFANAADRAPSLVDFSVGISTYAAAPDSLLIFHDIPTRTVYLLQAKGCFKALLPTESEHPELSPDLAWYQLPRILYQDLARLEIPKPKELSEDELALSDGLVIRLKDLHSGKATLEVVARVSERDNLKSVSVAETLAGRGKQFQAWTKSQQAPLPKVPLQRPDVGGNAKKAIAALLAALKEETSEEMLANYRATLRTAYETNWEEFREVLAKHKIQTRLVTESNQRYQRAGLHSRSISSNPLPKKSNFSTGVSMGYDMLDEPNVGAVALVSTVNKSPWLKALRTVCEGKVAEDELFKVFVDSFEAPVNQKMILELEEGSLFRETLEWVKQDFSNSMNVAKA